MCRPEPAPADSPYPGRGYRSLTPPLSALACQPPATVTTTSLPPPAPRPHRGPAAIRPGMRPPGKLRGTSNAPSASRARRGDGADRAGRGRGAGSATVRTRSGATAHPARGARAQPRFQPSLTTRGPAGVRGPAPVPAPADARGPRGRRLRSGWDTKPGANPRITAPGAVEVPANRARADRTANDEGRGGAGPVPPVRRDVGASPRGSAGAPGHSPVSGTAHADRTTDAPTRRAADAHRPAHRPRAQAAAPRCGQSPGGPGAAAGNRHRQPYVSPGPVLPGARRGPP